MTSNAFKSWTPSVSAKHPDHIVSSEFTTTKIFRPSYEKNEPCMEQLMANEYQRMWLTERDEWLKKINASDEENKRRPRAINAKEIDKKENGKLKKITTSRSTSNSQGKADTKRGGKNQ